MADTSAPSWVRRVPAICGVLASLLGAASFLGSAVGWNGLSRLGTGMAPIKPAAALGFMGAGVCLMLADQDARWSRLLTRLAASSTLVSAIVLAVELGRDGVARMIVLLMFAMPFLVTRPRVPGWHARLRVGFGAAFLMLATMVGIARLYMSPSMSSNAGLTGVSMLAVIATALLGVGLSALLVQELTFRWLWDNSLTARIVRRVGPVAVLLPPILGFLRQLGQDAGLYDTRIGGALYACAMVFALVAFLAVTARTIHAAEMQRTDLARQLEAFFDNLPGMLSVRDNDGRFVRINTNLAHARGMEPEDAVGKFPVDVLGEEVSSEVKAQDEQILHTRAGITAEMQLQGSDGELRDYHVTRFPILDRSRQMIGLATYALDITARKAAEQAATAAADRLRTLLDAAPDATVIVDEAGVITYANRRITELLGYEIDELVGQRVEVLVPDSVRPRHQGLREGFIAHPSPRPMAATLDLAARHKDGRSIPVEISLGPLHTEDGILTSAAIRDVTARKAAERAAKDAAARFRALLDAAPDATVIVDEAGVITYANARITELLGYELDDLVGQRVEVLVPDATRPHHQSLREGFVAHPSPRPMAATHDLTARHKDGRSIPVEISLGPLHTDDGILTSAAIRDVSAKRAAAETLAAAEQLFRSTFDDAPIGMAVLGVDGHIRQANQSLAGLVAEHQEDLIGASIFDLIHPNDLERFQEAIGGLMGGSIDHIALDLRVLTARFEPHEADLRATLLRDDSGNPARLLVQVQDVADRKRFEEQLQYMADHDPLTGLFNRRRFQTELTEHVMRCKRYGPEGALISLDIDHFKQVNDTLGHNIGDQLIISVANVLRSRLRESDVLARLGGDEFAVLLPRASQAEAAQVGEMLVEAIRSHSGLLNGYDHSVTTSAGITMFDRPRGGDLSGEEVLIESDVALYDAKEAGRDTIAFFAEPHDRTSRMRARQSWTSRIQRALKEERFMLMAQPILDLHTGTMEHYELLLRMLDDDGEPIPPNAFLYVAERYGLVTQIDEWVFNKAVDAMEQRPELTIEVNLSAQSLGDQRLLDVITRRLSHAEIDPHRLIFEVTETAAVSNITQAQAFAHTLRDLGCRFALDDFGAGFGSFYYLKHLPFDFVKIDGEFVQHATSNRMDQLIISALVRIAGGLEKQTIAEFVTNTSTRDLVTALGVDFAQGYGVALPMPLKSLLNGLQPTT